MSAEATYLWIVEWDDQFVQPQRIQVRHVTRMPGVTDDELERQLIDDAIPAQQREATRVGGVRRQLLVKLTGEHAATSGFGTQDEGVATPLGAAAVSTGSNGVVIWRSDEATSG